MQADPRRADHRAEREGEQRDGARQQEERGSRACALRRARPAAGAGARRARSPLASGGARREPARATPSSAGSRSDGRGLRPACSRSRTSRPWSPAALARRTGVARTSAAAPSAHLSSCPRLDDERDATAGRQEVAAERRLEAGLPVPPGVDALTEQDDDLGVDGVHDAGQRAAEQDARPRGRSPAASRRRGRRPGAAPADVPRGPTTPRSSARARRARPRRCAPRGTPAEPHPQSGPSTVIGHVADLAGTARRRRGRSRRRRRSRSRCRGRSSRRGRSRARGPCRTAARRRRGC